jgi:sugar O-acyltransferase (sialic acid O-acetyltransferase NeuD family)
VSLSSNRKKLAVFGTGQIADIVTYYFAKSGRSIHCYIVDDESISIEKFLQRPVYQVADFFHKFKPTEVETFVAISYHNQNSWREKYFKLLTKNGFECTNYISQQAFVQEDVLVGSNCLILEGSVIQKTCEIRENSYIWTGVQIGHHSIVGANAFLGAGAILMGCNSVGRNAHISANCTIKDHLEVKDKAYIPPGSVLLV